MTRNKTKRASRVIWPSALDKKKLIFGVLILAFVLASIATTIQTASNGAELSNLEKTAGKLEEDNKALSEVLVEKSSLSKIEKKAEELGFVKADNILYLTPDEDVASLK